MARKGQKGSRRWRRYRASRRKAEARHHRRVRQAQHEAAKMVVAWLVDHEVGTVVVGDPKGITTRDCGRRQNLALRNWRRTHLLACLSDKAELAGIKVVLVNERGTSSTCPECIKAVPKPRGRRFSCPHCGHRGHRDLVGARNIAARGGGSTRAPARVTHRRAGRPGSRSQGGRPGATSVASGMVHAVEDGTLRGSQRSHVDMHGINAGVHYDQPVVIADPRVGERVASVAASLEPRIAGLTPDIRDVAHVEGMSTHWMVERVSDSLDRVVGQVLDAYESARER